MEILSNYISEEKFFYSCSSIFWEYFIKHREVARELFSLAHVLSWVYLNLKNTVLSKIFGQKNLGTFDFRHFVENVEKTLRITSGTSGMRRTCLIPYLSCEGLATWEYREYRNKGKNNQLSTKIIYGITL